MKTTILTGDKAMKAWNSTWRHGHLPRWMKDLVRSAALAYLPKELGLMIGPRGRWFRFAGLWDHVGTIRRSDGFAVVSSPYERNDSRAEEFARRVGCNVEVFDVSPWSPSACMYVFSQLADAVVPSYKERLKASEFVPGMRVRWLKGRFFDPRVCVVDQVENQGTSRAAVRFLASDGSHYWSHTPGNRYQLISQTTNTTPKP